ncbi:hypothetical protein [Nannocystis punicea]|uniref:Uncharacterized protein n=1 Tax=Nannocystis punicea TaxID=2995304 RepID=A0ABY7GZP6_9BACT|nr:hypothetical protein [Nannocystis poenicansa]WAS92453.1 hypothetical protein O0S08_40255 [Nannocystis poenicansa]
MNMFSCVRGGMNALCALSLIACSTDEPAIPSTGAASEPVDAPPAECSDAWLVAQEALASPDAVALGVRRCGEPTEEGQVRLVERLRAVGTHTLADWVLAALYDSSDPGGVSGLSAERRALRADIVYAHAGAVKSRDPRRSVDILRTYLRGERYERSHVGLLLEILVQRHETKEAVRECEYWAKSEHGLDCVLLLHDLMDSQSLADLGRSWDALVVAALARAPYIGRKEFEALVMTRPSLWDGLSRFWECNRLDRCLPWRCPWKTSIYRQGGVEARSGNQLYYALARTSGVSSEVRECAAKTAASWCITQLEALGECAAPEAVLLYFREHVLDPEGGTRGASWRRETVKEISDVVSDLRRLKNSYYLMPHGGPSWRSERTPEALFMIHYSLAAAFSAAPELQKPGSPYLVERFQTCRMRLFHKMLHGTEMACGDHPGATGRIVCTGKQQELRFFGTTISIARRCRVVDHEP